MLVNEPDTNDRPDGASGLRHESPGSPAGRGAALEQSMALAQIVALMLQSPNHRHFSLSDLEWMVLPPLRLGQLAIAETKQDQNGLRQPLAVMFWASVSPAIDKRLSSNLDAPIRLRPDEWRSGEVLWIADMIGDMNNGHTLVKNVMDTVLAGRTVKVRSMDSAGKRIVLEVTASAVTVVQTSATVSTSGSECGKSDSCPQTGMLCASCIKTGCTGRCRKGGSSGTVNPSVGAASLSG